MTEEKLNAIRERIEASMTGGWHVFLMTDSVCSTEATRGRGANANFRCFDKNVHKNDDKNPSMSVNNERGNWRCFACGTHGSWITLLKGYGIEHPVKYLCEKFNIDMYGDGLISPEVYRKIRTFAEEEVSDEYRPEIVKRLILTADEEERYSVDKKVFNEKIAERYTSGCQAIGRVFEDAVPTGINVEWINKKHEFLMSEKYKERRMWLIKNKGISEDVMMKFRVGWDPAGDDEDHDKEKETVLDPRSWKFQSETWRDRYIIPLRDAKGVYVNAKRYRTDAKPKTLPYRTSDLDKGLYYPYSEIWPGDVMADSTIYWMEGETDMLCAQSHGLPAMTTGGATSFFHIDPKLFKGKRVVICFDIDDPGRVAAVEAANLIVNYVAEVKVIKLEKTNPGKEDDINPMGLDVVTAPKGDFVDFMKLNKWNIAVFDELVSKTKAWVSKGIARNQPQRYRISLGSCDHPTYHDQNVECVARVEELQDSSYFQYPVTVGCICERDNPIDKRPTPYCSRCIMEKDNMFKETDITFDISNASYRDILAMVNVSDSRQKEIISSIIGVPSKCTMVRYTPKQVGRLYEVVLVPDKDEAGVIDISGSVKDNRSIVPHKEIEGYIKTININVVSCKTYLFSGRPLNHPKTQKSILFIDSVEPLQNSIEGFKLDDEKVEYMRVFKAESDDVDGIDAKLADIYSEFERLTGVLGRRDIFLVCDLVMHSVDSFKYDQSPLLERGWVEGVILGQSRTAKSYVAKFVHNHYKMGEFIAAGMLTRSGIVGGSASTAGGGRHIKWGAYPRNNRGHVTIDEFSSIDLDVIMSMIDMRTSGRAQISGISSGTVESRVRSLSLSNARREGRESYDGDDEMDDGVKEYKKLYFGKEQAMSRVDIALCVLRGDVDSNEFVKMFNRTPNNNYTSIQCQTLIKWCWSRNKDEVMFAEGAYDAIRKFSKKLSEKYHGSVGLINESETHVKLARLSAALAARLFSCSDDASCVVVKPCHVEYMYNTLESFYSGPNMKYDQYSIQMKRQTTLGDMTKVNEILKECDIATLLSTDHITQSKIKTIFHPYISRRVSEAHGVRDFRMNDSVVANEIIYELQKSHAVSSVGNGYKKIKPFAKRLEAMMMAKVKDSAENISKAIDGANT